MVFQVLKRGLDNSREVKKNDATQAFSKIM